MTFVSRVRCVLFLSAMLIAPSQAALLASGHGPDVAFWDPVEPNSQLGYHAAQLTLIPQFSLFDPSFITLPCFQGCYLIDQILTPASVGLEIILDSSYGRWAELVQLLHRPDARIEMYTLWSMYLPEVFNLPPDAPLFSGSTITSVRVTIESRSFTQTMPDGRGTLRYPYRIDVFGDIADVQATPEPGTLAMMGLPLFILLTLKFRATPRST